MNSLHHTELRNRAKALRLNGLIEHWDEVCNCEWLAPLLKWEEDERAHRSLQRRLRDARIGTFKGLADFDWQWPSRIDQDAVSELMSLSFMKDANNVVLSGPNGVGKTTIARNIAYQAIIAGHSVMFRSASELLGELGAIESDAILRRRLRYYTAPDLLAIDEVGYLSYSNRHADLLYELISRRHESKSTMITTNKQFSQWSEVFPNAACVGTLLDRLVHHCEVISIEGDSWRLKESRERSEASARRRRKKAAARKNSTRHG